ncbi:MAG: acyclic terpene utilization AtuA family protein [Marmoricola sp.]
MTGLDKLDQPVRIANCSGFYGDRLSAMREVLTGGPVDVVTGDYLAELTMLILGRDQLKDATLGYARTFVRQLEDCLGTALERGIRIVSNAGGLNPAGLADRLREVAQGLGLAPAIAHVEGDNLASRAAELGLGNALTANAYLGGFGIAEALRRGADVVVTGRVTDASMVVGPAVAHFGWGPTSYDELAGAVVAGHVIECGTQATGGNFSGFLSLRRDAAPLGFPIAELRADGSSVITKHDGTGGVVSVDTVTAQLMYEVQGPQYLNADVTVDLTSITLAPEGDDRVLVSGVRGSVPPEQLKVSVNELGGYRNQMEFVLVGLDVEEKAAWVRAQLEAGLAANRPATVDWTLGRFPDLDPDTEEAGSCLLRVSVKDPSADVVGRSFSAAAVELALASYPGFSITAPPGAGSPYGVYRPAYVDRSEVEQVVVLGSGERVVVADPFAAGGDSLGASGARDTVGGGHPLPRSSVARHARATASADDAPGASAGGQRLPTEAATRRVPLGTFVQARSGDKGGDANVGLWVGQGDRREERVDWLLDTVTPDWVRALLPETKDLDVEVHPLRNLGGVNVLVHGLLGAGVAASTRFDPQAKGLGEWLRARYADVPEVLL